MDLQEIMEKLRGTESGERIFSQIMRAKSIKELIDLDITPEKVLSYFTAAEELGKLEEDCIFYEFTVVQRLKDASPVKQRRAFFI